MKSITIAKERKRKAECFGKGGKLLLMFLGGSS